MVLCTDHMHSKAMVFLIDHANLCGLQETDVRRSNYEQLSNQFCFLEIDCQVVVVVVGGATAVLDVRSGNSP